VAGNRAFIRDIKKWTGGMGVATGAEACERALQLFGAKKIGVVTPYQEIGDENVIKFFSEIGFEVVKIKGLRCPTAVAIAHVSEDELRQALLEVDGEDVDAIVQAGTNLSMVKLADEAERWLGKPVIAINAATWWFALRENGIEDKVYGCGRLLREY
jgi:maleate isomerase